MCGMLDRYPGFLEVKNRVRNLKGDQFKLTSHKLLDLIKVKNSRVMGENLTKIKNLFLEEDIQSVDDKTLQQMMDTMEAGMEEQDQPKVGIFWYDPRTKTTFGEVTVDAQERAQIEHRDQVSCKELYKYVWKKHFNKDKSQGKKTSLYYRDYKDVPRGRVFYLPKEDRYLVMVGHWIDSCPEAKLKIREAFDLVNPDLDVRFAYGEHWEIGMGYGD